ncbi:type II toxin-antitoxin system Phd/YefM family antitoxin [Oxalobacteraceae bacterium A2-2]
MRTVTVEEAAANLARLIDEAAAGNPFTITRDGKPLVQVARTEEHPMPTGPRTGFLKGQYEIPDDFDTMCSEEIIRMFEGDA